MNSFDFYMQNFFNQIWWTRGNRPYSFAVREFPNQIVDWPLQAKQINRINHKISFIWIVQITKFIDKRELRINWTKWIWKTKQIYYLNRNEWMGKAKTMIRFNLKCTPHVSRRCVNLKTEDHIIKNFYKSKFSNQPRRCLNLNI